MKEMTLDEIVKQLPEGHNAKVEWKQIQSEIWFLECLHGAGVDNWDGFDEARQMYIDLGEKFTQPS